MPMLLFWVQAHSDGKSDITIKTEWDRRQALITGVSLLFFHMYGTEEKHGLCGNFLGKESLRRTSLHKNRHFMARYHHFMA